MFKDSDEVLKFLADNDVAFVDVRFCDLPGVMQHFNMPAASFGASAFSDGLMFDGSSIRGFQQIHESDMKLVPDAKTAFVDPFRAQKTLVINHSIVDPFTDEPYSRDPRNIAAKAEAHLRGTGIADTSYWGAEAEFYVFDDIRFETKANAGYYFIDSVEAAWNTGRSEEGGNRGYKTRYKGGYFPVPPVDHFADLRDVMTQTLGSVGLEVERAHHEVGTAGQQEINYRFSTLQHSADQMMLFKYVIKNVAWRAGKTVTFMPKPLFGDNGSGMHSHQSLWKNGDPLFFDERGYGGLSDTARWYIGGLLRHASSLLAFTNPSVNSYHRLVPGFEAPVNLVYSQRNRSACVRIPVTGTSPKAKRIEFRVPDPSSNPYLAFSAMLMAGIDGFTPDLIETWIEFKRRNEVDPIRLRPHPHEFELYFDI
jgi:glutamine synthetase